MTYKQPASVEATTYLQLEAVSARWGTDAAGNRILEAAKVVNATQTRPAKQKPGTVLVKLKVRVPVGAFLPLAPEAVVVIPEGMTVHAPIEVEAQEPGAETVHAPIEVEAQEPGAEE